MEIAEERLVANERDGGWFCDECDMLHHWTEKAFVINGKKYCEKCLIKFYPYVFVRVPQERN